MSYLKLLFLVSALMAASSQSVDASKVPQGCRMLTCSIDEWQPPVVDPTTDPPNGGAPTTTGGTSTR